jgi:hypothetical protein
MLSTGVLGRTTIVIKVIGVNVLVYPAEKETRGSIPHSHVTAEPQARQDLNIATLNRKRARSSMIEDLADMFEIHDDRSDAGYRGLNSYVFSMTGGERPGKAKNRKLEVK